jgi:hypothetical protein
MKALNNGDAVVHIGRVTITPFQMSDDGIGYIKYVLRDTRDHTVLNIDGISWDNFFDPCTTMMFDTKEQAEIKAEQLGLST